MDLWQCLLIVIVLLVILIGFLSYSNHYVVVTKHTYSNTKLPPAFQGYRILQISDLHGDLPEWKIKRLIRLAHEANPDIIVFTGDAIDHVHRRHYARVTRCVEQLVKDFTIYYVTGNHEYMHHECECMIADLEKLGVSVLHDQEVKLTKVGDSISILGIDDPYAIYEGNVPPKYITPVDEFKEKLRRLPHNEERFSVLLTHRPEFFEDYVEGKYDLVFAGHAHGGQWKVPFIGGFIAPDQGLFPKYIRGKYQQKGTTMFVSRGLGNSVVPFRLFNLPELVLVVLSRD